MAIDKQQVLAQVSLGQRVAEDELDELASYFVETDQWRKILSGQKDVIFGPKGSGKSALYSALVARAPLFREKEDVLLISTERPQGTPAFKNLVSDPPTSETEFVGLWKLYVLSLIGSELERNDVDSESARQVRSVLAKEGLLPPGATSLSERVKSVVDYVRRWLLPQSLESTIHFDAAGNATGIGTKITPGEPTDSERASGVWSVDALIAQADKALEEAGLHVWVLFDRLDVAFADSRALEANALRALFKCYLDAMAARRIRFKIFLRTDIWNSINEGGFREASHITRTLTIKWSEPTLLNLVVRRLLKSDLLVASTGVTPARVLSSAEEQRKFFDQLVPEKVDVGNNPMTFGWILGRVKDGTNSVAPREVIHLLTEAKDAQASMLERGEEPPPGQEILTRQALREALLPVSRARLEQTVYAEYPVLKPAILALAQEKTEQDKFSLSLIWDTGYEEARAKADELVAIGFFERRGDKSSPRYWVPFLYRPGLGMVQGVATL